MIFVGMEVSSDSWLFGSYHNQARRILESLTVVKHSAGYTVSASSGDEFFTIHSAQYLRETKHSFSDRNDAILHLTEVRQLQIVPTSAITDQFEASLKFDEELVKDQDLWYEAAISSKSATATLKSWPPNALGQKTKWDNSKNVTEKMVTGLFEACEAVISRIDHVGLENKGMTAQTPGSSEPVEQQSQQSTNPPAPAVVNNTW